ncbi:unnamed protein product [Toxocara canis]|uniref:Neur_chan_memb domain-containing protein n=1 Tax=Toxocara canis TaxID=6265 RepID=A0A183V0Z9_TOXCA|nr:unnamed protein product [Toxocara canis]
MQCVFNLVIPSTIITLVAVIGFHTPSTSGRVRDAKFRLGIMTLMSMSVILLAIVEDMPKFSMSSSRRGRGSFSGIPLIGLYYFILLAIIGLSTVTTSMFVFLERDVRVKHQIPWYLRWLSFDIANNKITSRNYANIPAMPLVDAIDIKDALLAYENANGHARGAESQLARESRSKVYARSVAMSLLQLIPESEHSDTTSAAHFPYADQEISSPSPRQNLRKRLSIAQYDNMLIYQYFNQLLEDLMTSVSKIENAVHGIREEIVSLLPQDDLNSRWQTVIRRLEIISLIFYVSLVCITVFLFFYHDWYCAIGHNPCGQVNLKCPWMQVEPTHPHCL